MSIRMNGYEQNLKNRLQYNLTKQEAEDAVLIIREALYGNSYEQIHPIYIGNNNGTASKVWPSVNTLIEAYYNNDYESVEEFMELREEVIEEQKLPNALTVAESIGYHDVTQNNPHHFGTVSQHVDAVVDNLPQDVSENVKIAALLHDIGKFDTISVNPKTGYSQFIKHANKSVEIIDNNIDSLLPSERFSEADREYIKELVKLHDTKYSKQGKCQTMLNEHPDGFARDLIALQYANVMGQSEFSREAKLQEVMNFANLLLQVGTPEQTVGLDNITDMIEESIYDDRENSF